MNIDHRLKFKSEKIVIMLEEIFSYVSYKK